MKSSFVGSILAMAVCISFPGCKKEEPPPPLPTAQPVATAAPPLQLKAEDAGVEVIDAAPPKKTGGGGRAGGLGPCCAALSQNATMAPEPTKTYMLQTAALCQGLAATGKDKAAVGGILLGALKGAGMPVQCK